MTDLDNVENDADGAFGFDPVANAVQGCPADPPPTLVSADKKHWIEIVLLDEDKNPVPGHAYRIQLPGGGVVTGKLNSKGRARVDGIDPGTCKVTFPQLDKSSWDRAQS